MACCVISWLLRDQWTTHCKLQLAPKVAFLHILARKFVCNVNDTRALIGLCLLVTSHWNHIRDPWYSQAFTIAHMVPLAIYPCFYSSKLPCYSDMLGPLFDVSLARAFCIQCRYHTYLQVDWCQSIYHTWAIGMLYMCDLHITSRDRVPYGALWYLVISRSESGHSQATDTFLLARLRRSISKTP